MVEPTKEIDIKRPLYILGFVPVVLNVLIELADDAFGFRSFCVLENIDRPSDDYFVSSDRYDVKFKAFHTQSHRVSTNEHFVLGVLGIKSKEVVYRYFKDKIGMDDNRFLNLLHPTAVISNSAIMGDAVQVGVQTSVSALAQIGFGVNIKNNCYIGHHVKLGNFVTVNPSVTINGLVEIGNNTIIGAGSVVRDKIKIGANCIIGMGSNVVSDIPDNSIAFGNPCKINRENT